MGDRRISLARLGNRGPLDFRNRRMVFCIYFIFIFGHCLSLVVISYLISYLFFFFFSSREPRDVVNSHIISTEVASMQTPHGNLGF